MHYTGPKEDPAVPTKEENDSLFVRQLSEKGVGGPYTIGLIGLNRHCTIGMMQEEPTILDTCPLYPPPSSADGGGGGVDGWGTRVTYVCSHM